jgi:hypothetical protein
MEAELGWGADRTEREIAGVVAPVSEPVRI